MFLVLIFFIFTKHKMFNSHFVKINLTCLIFFCVFSTKLICMVQVMGVFLTFCFICDDENETSDCVHAR